MTIDIISDWQHWELETKKGMITMEILPISTREILKLMNLDPSQVPDTIETIFPDHVRNIKGLTIDSREPIGKDFANNPSLFPIATRIIERLTSTDELLDTEIKNS